MDDILTETDGKTIPSFADRFTLKPDFYETLSVFDAYLAGYQSSLSLVQTSSISIHWNTKSTFI